MLAGIRKFASSYAAKALFVILIASFGVWGVGDYVSGGLGINEVARVGDATITTSEFSRAFDREYQRARQLFGANFTRDQARQFGIADQALQGLIVGAMLQEEARRLGLAAPDQAVAQQIRSQPGFQGLDGRFDTERYEQALAINGFTRDQYETSVRDDLTREQLVSAVNSGVAAPKALTDAIWSYMAERRQIELLRIDADKLEAPAPATDQDIQAYFDENQARFRRPQYRALSYVWLTPDEVIDEIAVNEEDIVALFEERSGELSTPERRTVEQILVEDAEQAARVVERLRAGEAFEAVAEDAAGIAADLLTLGSFSQSELPDELAEPAFALNLDAFSEPIESSLGWHILRITEIEPGVVPTFDDARDELRRELAMEQAFDALSDLANRLDDALGGGADLEGAAGEIGAEVRKIARMDSAGQDETGSPIDGLPSAPEFLSEAFAAEPGETGFLTEVGDGYFVLRVDDVIEATVPPLADVRASVEAALSEQRRSGQSEAKAAELAETLRGGATLEEAAPDDPAVAAETPDPIDRRGEREGGAPSGVPGALLPLVFDAAVGEVVIAQAPNGHVVARVKQVLPAEGEAQSLERTQLAESILAGLRSDLVVQFTESLRHRFSASVNQQALDRMFTPADHQAPYGQ